MTWGIAADIATTFGVFVALVGVIVSAFLGVRSERASASRSEAAARLSDENARLTIAALEKIAAHQPGHEPLQVATKVAWAMTHYKGDTYQLQNIGDKTAYEVEIDPARDANMIFRKPAVADLNPEDALTFLAAKTMATLDSTITVAWTEEGDNTPHEWRYPLPPRPPR
ncbi:hypothetical protein [Propionibacterium freudenreichii]|uniref:hypothetical protein n=1 Tax=Propionibacterium freudenreichii TaxID=1744 RepID=UPI0005432152|nr:hypothetical protein [Propionibacterium freudenreichii]AJQ90055.1 Hypothetical protein RM25_0323 [Propionibacterium freudenreichii subsp. freudenreichii]MDK9302559.1 hypothetical protein [Propionibacterium freudenreichii]MDK9322207.1 hypothetical protein [Propionibacterium freudenreichii]MDK9324541.1 hypothetical protein [Propionibacterium freudenreichii]MDK9343127.1 hypothetical protein [Propionibacterium freudenreichii]